MIARKSLLLLALAAISLVLASCGSSSSPTAVKTTSKGAITALGSIFVNGVEYVTTGAGVTVDGSSGTTSDLLVGKVVTVKGAESDDVHGSAVEIDFKDNLEGPVDVTPTAGGSQFQALGQTVSVNTTAANVAAGKTIFRNFTSLSQLAANSVVEVSGFPNASGVIQATFVELKGTLAATTAIELKGTIANLNTTAKTFTVNALTVNYTAAQLADMPSGGIANGLFVEVSGVGSGYTGGASPTLAATVVSAEREDANGTEGEHLSVEGFATGFVSGNPVFKVNGQQVNIGTLSVVGIDMTKRVEVEGVLTNGVLMATSIKQS